MNYIILNGVNSNTITGLLIQSLPPISKPLIRTEIEEIDGRDGDIVTKLGYAAYDKDITIGLHGTFDINAIIKFFDSEGIVTFSNEPEKYYRYQIIAQIDFERLIRFRTAKVTFHIQPFKYKADEEPLTFYSDGVISMPTLHYYVNNMEFFTNRDSLEAYGTPNNDVHIWIGIDDFDLEPNHEYTAQIIVEGSLPEGCKARLLWTYAAQDANSFGGEEISLADGVTTVTDTLTEAKTLKWIRITTLSGTENDWSMRVIIRDESAGQDGFTVTNLGNVAAKPTLTLTGSGTINLSINDLQIFVLDLGEDQTTMTIDAELLEAYNPESNDLMNRNVTGDIDNLLLDVGANAITWTGDMRYITISNYSRWI